MTSSPSPYPKYTSSAVVGLGDIPSHWEERRAKFYLREVDERSRSGMEEQLSVSHLTGVSPRRHRNVTMVAESYSGHKLCRPGDVVVNTMWAWMAALGVSHGTGLVSPSYGVYRPRNPQTFDSAYLDHLLRLPGYASEYRVNSTGVTSSRLRLYADKFLNITLIHPPLEEQQGIVKYLRHVERRVGVAIRAKQRLVSLLDEQRASVIQHAVTCGVPGGTSSPDCWKSLELRRITSLVTSGSRGWAKYYSDSGRWFLQSGNIGRRLSLKLDRVQCVTVPNSTEGVRTRVRVGDLLVCITGAMTGNVGIVQEDPKFPSYVNQHVALIRPRPDLISSGFLGLALHSHSGQQQFKMSEYGGTKQGLGLAEVKSTRVPVPPIDVQAQIERYTAQETRRIESAISHAEREISLLREYQTRLTADVVTGKLDVRAAAAALPDLDPQDPDLTAAYAATRTG